MVTHLVTPEHEVVATPAPRVLVVDPDGKHRRRVARALRAAAGQVEEREELSEVPADGVYDLIVLDERAVDDSSRDQVLARFAGGRARTALLLLVDQTEREQLVHLFGSYAVRHLVAKNETAMGTRDLLVTASKVLRRDIFGIEKYFGWGAEKIEMSISDSAEKNQIVDAAGVYASNLGLNRRFVGKFCAVADEFVTNGLYNAPVDAQGNRRYAHVPRTERVQLPAAEAVRVSFCCDGLRLGISSIDPFGSLDPSVVVSYLTRCLRKGSDQVDDKQGGAGLGLYYVFESVSHFILNVHPGRATEMVAMIDISGSFRDFSALGKCFHLFVAEARDSSAGP